MRCSLFLWATIIGVVALHPGIASAEGLFYQLPEDGSWVRFDVQYTFKTEGVEQSGQQTMTMASVGKAAEGSEACRWIEFKIEAVENGAERLWIRKLLVPEKYLKKGENPTLHVVRGWTKQESGDVERAVPVHGRWPAFLAGPLQDAKKLSRQSVESKLGPLMCEGETGWIQFREGNLETKVTFEARLHEKAPFGVVASRMVFDVRGEGTPYTIDATAKLVDFGRGAESALPDYK
jgi:hypothetical protein